MIASSKGGAVVKMILVCSLMALQASAAVVIGSPESASMDPFCGN
jgi:hypothetical protein